MTLQPPARRLGTAARRLLVACALPAAAAGVAAGLSRLGVPVGAAASLSGEHGLLWVLGVFGTLISLERAVALGNAWGYAAPTFGAGYILSIFLGFPGGNLLALALSASLVLVNVALQRRQDALHTRLMTLGAVLLLLSCLRLARDEAPALLVWLWVAYFVVTIVAERIELSRLAPTPPWAFGVVAGLCLALAVFSGLGAPERPWARLGMGLCLGGLGGWLFRFDLARRTVRLPGLPRYSALGILGAAGWLLVAGALFLQGAIAPGTLLWDAALHALFIGFVLSMVLAHAPLIFPTVARARFDFHPAFYLPLGALHLSLAVRVCGDALGRHELRVLGAQGNAASLALFALVLAWRMWSRGAAARIT